MVFNETLLKIYKMTDDFRHWHLDYKMKIRHIEAIDS